MFPTREIEENTDIFMKWKDIIKEINNNQEEIVKQQNIINEKYTEWENILRKYCLRKTQLEMKVIQLFLDANEIEEKLNKKDNNSNTFENESSREEKQFEENVHQLFLEANEIFKTDGKEDAVKNIQTEKTDNRQVDNYINIKIDN